MMSNFYSFCKKLIGHLNSLSLQQALYEINRSCVGLKFVILKNVLYEKYEKCQYNYLFVIKKMETISLNVSCYYQIKENYIKLCVKISAGD